MRHTLVALVSTLGLLAAASPTRAQLMNDAEALAIGKAIVQNNPYAVNNASFGGDFPIAVRIEDGHAYWYAQNQVHYVERGLQIPYTYGVPPMVYGRTLTVDHLLVGLTDLHQPAYRAAVAASQIAGNSDLNLCGKPKPGTMPSDDVLKKVGRYLFEQHPFFDRKAESGETLRLRADWEKDMNCDPHENFWHFGGSYRYVGAALRIPLTYRDGHGGGTPLLWLLIGYQGSGGH